jgi:hypothetical protein
VNAASLTVTASNESKTYGATFTPNGTTQFTTSGLLNGDTVTSVTLASSGYAATAGVGSSPYSIVPSAAQGSGLGNYSITYTNGQLTVNAASLTITANGATKSYGAANPSFSYTPSGFVNGDTASVLTGAPSLTTTATATSSAGSYTITAAAGTLAASNYSFLFVNGTLTINQATPSVTTWPTASSINYGQTLASSTLSGGASTPAGSFAFTTPTTVPSAGTASQSVTFTPTDTTDYNTVPGTASVTVNKASQTISFTASSPVTYGVSQITLSATGGASGNAVTFSVVSGPGTISGSMLTVTGAGTIVVAANQASNTNYSAATQVTANIVVNKATPTITWATPAPITYGMVLSSTQLNATASVAGTFVYSPAAGTTPAVGSDTLSVTFTPTDTTDYATATASVTLVVTAYPVPVISSMSPAFTSAGGSAFTLTIAGTGFVSGSTAYWGTTSLVTTYVSATQLTAQVTASSITTEGTTAVTVQTPTPGGGTSNSILFEVDSTGSTTTAPTLTSLTATVTAGATASYPVTLPSSVTSVTVTCLNLPTGATCSYSSTTNAVTITTSSTTPKGTFQVTVVFTETVSGAATAGILLPILLLPLLFMRRKLAARGVWLTACLGLVLVTAAVFGIGCGGGGFPNPVQMTSSGTVNITVQ